MWTPSERVACAYADTTYQISTTTSYRGTVFGTVIGVGTSLSAFDVFAVNGPTTFSFDSSMAGDTGYSDTTEGYTLSNGTPVNFLSLFDGATASTLEAPFIGDLTSGLTYVGGQQGYVGGVDVLTLPASSTTEPGLFVFTSDDVSFTPQSNIAMTPEPSSFALLGTGLLAVTGVVKRRFA